MRVIVIVISLVFQGCVTAQYREGLRSWIGKDIKERLMRDRPSSYTELKDGAGVYYFWENTGGWTFCRIAYGTDTDGVIDDVTIGDCR